MELLRSIRFETDYAIVTYRGHTSGSYALDFERDFFSSVPKSKPNPIQKEKKNNRHKGELSKQAYQRLKRAVSWLELIADEKPGIVKWKCSFLTLTIPEFSVNLHEKLLKSVLNVFLTWLRRSQGIKSYVWKAELTKKGNLHYHLLSDLKMSELECRKKWNSLLIDNGLMKMYTEKFEKMSLTEYLEYRTEKEGPPENDYYNMRRNQAYNYGKMSSWTDPKSVQVDEIPSTDSVVNYLGKYLGKNSSGENDEKLTGRIWGCSQNLSHKNTLRLEVDPMSREVDVLKDLLNLATGCEDIEIEVKGIKKTIGYKIKYSSEIWKTDGVGSRLCMLISSYFSLMKSGEIRHDYQQKLKSVALKDVQARFELHRLKKESQIKGKVYIQQDLFK